MRGHAPPARSGTRRAAAAVGLCISSEGLVGGLHCIVIQWYIGKACATTVAGRERAAAAQLFTGNARGQLRGASPRNFQPSKAQVGRTAYSGGASRKGAATCMRLRAPRAWHTGWNMLGRGTVYDFGQASMRC